MHTLYAARVAKFPYLPLSRLSLFIGLLQREVGQFQEIAHNMFVAFAVYHQ